MGAKSRGNWRLGGCLKNCKHQGNDVKCGHCYRINGRETEFEPRVSRQRNKTGFQKDQHHQ
jgi:hypothetical protein